eukprot:3359404-Amphidinium_carterae.1
MVADQVTIKGLSRAGINAVRLNVKDFIPQKFKGNRSQCKPMQMMSCCSAQLRNRNSLSLIRTGC